MGAVLAGGSSRRMGRNKALIPVDGVPMARRVADAMVAAGAATVVLVGGSGAVGEELAMDVIDDRWPGEGPLTGVASAAAWALDLHAERLLVAACDQPNLTAELFSSLMERLEGASPDTPSSGAVTITPDGRAQPFPAVWLTTASAGMRSLVLGGERRADAAFALGVVTVPAASTTVVSLDRPEDLAT